MLNHFFLGRMNPLMQPYGPIPLGICPTSIACSDKNRFGTWIRPYEELIACQDSLVNQAINKIAMDGRSCIIRHGPALDNQSRAFPPP